MRVTITCGYKKSAANPVRRTVILEWGQTLVARLAMSMIGTLVPLTALTAFTVVAVTAVMIVIVIISIVISIVVVIVVAVPGNSAQAIQEIVQDWSEST
jgi:hypothetical protein